MVSGTGAFSGAASGAQLGSTFGPWGTGIGAAVGGLAGLFGGGKSEMEKAAERDLIARMNRGTEGWKMATEGWNQAKNYYAPILGGSREAALTALAPEIKAGTERLNQGRQSLFTMAPRTGGAGAMMDPYAAAKLGTNVLTQARPQAAQGMTQLAQTAGGWANMGQGGAGTIFEQERWRREQEEKEGAAAYDTLKRLMPVLKEQFGGFFGGGEKGGSKEGKTNMFGSSTAHPMVQRTAPPPQWNPKSDWYG